MGSASDWLKQISHTAQPVRSTTKIWLVMHHQYGVSALISQMSFHRETSGGIAKCQLFPQACLLQKGGIQIPRNEPTLLFRKSRGRRVLCVACLEAHVRAESLFSPHSTFLFWYNLAVAF